MAELLNIFLNIIETVFLLVGFAVALAMIVGTVAVFVVLVSGFGKRFIEEHEQNQQE